MGKTNSNKKGKTKVKPLEEENTEKNSNNSRNVHTRSRTLSGTRTPLATSNKTKVKRTLSSKIKSSEKRAKINTVLKNGEQCIVNRKGGIKPLENAVNSNRKSQGQQGHSKRIALTNCEQMETETDVFPRANIHREDIVQVSVSAGEDDFEELDYDDIISDHGELEQMEDEEIVDTDSVVQINMNRDRRIVSQGTDNVDSASTCPTEISDEQIMSNPRFGNILERMVKERVSACLVEVNLKHQGETSGHENKNKGMGTNSVNNGRNGRNQNFVKSPSDTTLYAPALNKTPERAVLITPNFVARNNTVLSGNVATGDGNRIPQNPEIMSGRISLIDKNLGFCRKHQTRNSCNYGQESKDSNSGCPTRYGNE